MEKTGNSKKIKTKTIYINVQILKRESIKYKFAMNELYEKLICYGCYVPNTNNIELHGALLRNIIERGYYTKSKIDVKKLFYDVIDVINTSGIDSHTELKTADWESIVNNIIKEYETDYSFSNKVGGGFTANSTILLDNNTSELKSF